MSVRERNDVRNLSFLYWFLLSLTATGLASGISGMGEGDFFFSSFFLAGSCEEDDMFRVISFQDSYNFVLT